MGTTTHGLRYPEPTDRVADGATAIHNLASDVDALLVLDAFSTFAPKVRQPYNGADLTITTNESTFRQLGKSVTGHHRLVIGSAGSTGNAIYVQLPVVPRKFTAAPGYSTVGGFTYWHGGTAYNGLMVTAAASVAGYEGYAALMVSAGTFVGSSPGFAVASGDILSTAFSYEAA